MDNDIIQAYLWQDVIRLGFQITKHHHQWIKTYLGSLQEFWEVYDYPCKDGPRGNGCIKARIDNPDLELWWEFDLRIDKHFHLEFNHLNGNIWWHHSDFDYYGLPIEKLLDDKERSLAIAEFSRDDLVIILDAMIFHGRAHQHIKTPFPENKIRIGGGIDNPFLYLFHLRYQLCPKEKRDAEKRRVTDLFETAIRTDHLIDDKLLFGT